MNFLILNVILMIGLAQSSKIRRYHDDIEEGSECPLENNRNGICQNFQNCKQTRSYYWILVCGFDRAKPIICCPKDQTYNQRKFVNLDYEYCVEEYLGTRYNIPKRHLVANGVNVWPGEFSNIVRWKITIFLYNDY